MEDASVRIIKTLQTNRKILGELLKNRSTCLVEECCMIIKGYNPVFHTHITKERGKEIVGCFEFGMIRCDRKRIKIIRMDKSVN